MSSHRGPFRLVVLGTTLALGTSLLVGVALASEGNPSQFQITTGGANGQAGPAKSAGQVAALTTYAQGATRRDGTISTPNGAQSGAASQQISSARVTQDLVGQRLLAVATYRAAPSAASNSVIEVYFGRWSGNTCQTRAAVLGAADGGTGAGAFFESGTQTGTFAVTSSRSGNVVTVTSATASAFRNADYDCTFALVRDVSGTPFFQSFFAVGLTTTYVPQLTISTDYPVQGSYSGKWTTIRLDAKNDGRTSALAAKVTASGSGLKFNRKSVNLGTLKDRRSKYGISFKVKLNGKKSRKATFTIRSAGGYSDSVRVTVARKPAPSRLKSLSGRYFWGNDTKDRTKGWDPRAIMFVNKKWAYVGFPSKGVPSCRKTTKNCKRYTYKSGRVKIAGSKRVKITSEGFKLGRVRFTPLSLPKKNAKLSLTLHHQDFRGCGVNPYCSTWTETLSMSNNRRFALTRTGISSIGYPGTGVISSRVGPHERGRYQVLSKGRIQLRFDNGKKVTTTIGIERDIRDKANPSGAGVVLGSVNYYRPRWST